MTHMTSATNLAYGNEIYCRCLGAKNSLQVIFNEPTKEDFTRVGVDCYAMFLQYLYQMRNNGREYVLELQLHFFAVLDEVYEKMLE